MDKKKKSKKMFFKDFTKKSTLTGKDDLPSFFQLKSDLELGNHKINFEGDLFKTIKMQK